MLVRTFSIGGLSRMALLAKLAACCVELNEAARTIIDSELFRASAAPRLVTTVELTIRDLGFPDGATTAALLEQALRRELQLCSLEVGPYFRLHHLDQTEGARGQPETRHCAPPGSITIASTPPSAHDDFPKGFYVRRIEGVLWLRGYRAADDHVWNADDRFLFEVDPASPFVRNPA